MAVHSSAPTTTSSTISSTPVVPPAAPSTAVTPASVSTPATTAAVVDPVVQARLAMTGKGESKVEELWKNSVEKTGNVFFKAVNAVCYFFGYIFNAGAYGEAHTLDIQIKEASKDFNHATTNLIKAAANRVFTAQECAELDIHPSVFSVPTTGSMATQQDNEVRSRNDFNRAVESFNKAFQNSLRAGGDNSPSTEKTRNYMQAAMWALDSESSEWVFFTQENGTIDAKRVSELGRTDTPRALHQPLLQEKLDLAKNTVLKSIYASEIQRYAGQDLEKIDLESIISENKAILAMFSDSNVSERNVDHALCQALLERNMIKDANGQGEIDRHLDMLIAPETLEGLTAARREVFVSERQTLLARLAELYTQADAASNTIFTDSGISVFGSQIHNAWTAWHGYAAAGEQARNADGSLKPNRVVVNGTEVDGFVGQDAWGNSIPSDQVWVWGVEQQKQAAEAKFMAHFSGAPTAAQLLVLANAAKSGTLAGQIATDATAFLNSIEAEESARATFQSLVTEREEKEARVADINRLDDVDGITLQVRREQDAKVEFLKIFAGKKDPKNSHVTAHVAGQLHRKKKAALLGHTV